MENRTEKPIDKVTTTNLDLALRMIGVQLESNLISHIIDLVELLEEKGDYVTIFDIVTLQEEWDSTERVGF